MSSTESKLEVLVKIAKVLNNHDITWCVGASLLLYFKGITEVFQDIDIMVMEEDVDRVSQILLEHGRLQPQNPNAQYKTKHFLEFVVDGVDIDVMAGFVIVSGGVDYYFPLERSSVKDFITVNNITIPLQSLEEWRTYYNLMGRVEKVKMIDSYFCS